MKNICLHGGPIFDGQRLIETGYILFNEKEVLSVKEGDILPEANSYIDVKKEFIIPGLVDLHSDALEKCIEMRPGVFFDAEFALQSLDKRLTACGITTFYHAISFGDDEIGLRSITEGMRLVKLVKQFNDSNQARISHKIHIRCEVSSNKGILSVKELIMQGFADLLSIMDHSPGQGQFREFETFHHFYRHNYKMSDSEIYILAERKKKLSVKGWKDINDLVALAIERKIPILSHDDDTTDKVNLLRKIGVSASEFPVSIEAAITAKVRNMTVLMGAPNFFRGLSSNSHISARDTVIRDLCDGLVSDYYPECMLHAPFIANSDLGIDLARAFKLVTSGPGGFIPDLLPPGQLTRGVPADFIIVSKGQSWAETKQTWVKGCRVS